MKLTCDLCGSELQTRQGGAICSHCGLEYGTDRLQEKMAQHATEQPVRKNSSDSRKMTAAKQKAQKRMKLMWIILALIGAFAFFSTLLTDGALPLISVPALLITLFIFKPWNVYGGKAI